MCKNSARSTSPLPQKNLPMQEISIIAPSVPWKQPQEQKDIIMRIIEENEKICNEQRPDIKYYMVSQILFEEWFAYIKYPGKNQAKEGEIGELGQCDMGNQTFLKPGHIANK